MRHASDLRSALLLRPATLAEYLKDQIIRVAGSAIEFTVDASWPARNERRLGYSQLVRLIEVARESHWKLLARKNRGSRLDSVIRWMRVSFDAPVLVGRTYQLSSTVTHVGNTSYDLEVRCRELPLTRITTTALLRSVLIRANDMSPVKIPSGLRTQLRCRSMRK